MRACEPWWATAVRGWLLMVKAIQEGYGEIGDGYRVLLTQVLEGGWYPQQGFAGAQRGPHAVYRLYEDFCTQMEAEQRSQRSRR